MKQINLENGYPVSPAARASCDGPLMLPLAAPLSLLGGQLWSLLGSTGTSNVWAGPRQEPGAPAFLFSLVQLRVVAAVSSTHPALFLGSFVGATSGAVGIPGSHICFTEAFTVSP